MGVVMADNRLKEEVRFTWKLFGIGFCLFLCFYLWLAYKFSFDFSFKVIVAFTLFYTLFFFIKFPVMVTAIGISDIEIFFNKCLDKETGIVKNFSPAYTLFSIDGKTCISLDNQRKIFLLIQRENDDIHDSRNLIKKYKFSQLLHVNLAKEEDSLDIFYLKLVLSLNDIDMPIFEIVLFAGIPNDNSRSLYDIQWDTAQEWLRRLLIVSAETDDYDTDDIPDDILEDKD